MRALVVDDHGLARKLERELLMEDCGFDEVEEAGSGLEGLALLAERPFDLVLVDISMPGLDGLAMIEIARARLPSQAFVVVSALDEPEYARRALEVGAAAFVRKGGSPKALADAARRALAGR